MNSNFILQTSHPLIQSEQTYVLDRKLISIHSVDRDYQKWPNSNHFGIDLGEAFHNVQSMRLINFAVPSNNYTFSNAYQNTKMSFTYQHTYEILLRNWGSPFPTISNSWSVFYQLMEANWGPGNTFNNKPQTVSVEYLVGGNWINIAFPVVPASSSAGPTGWSLQGPMSVRFVYNSPELTITIPEGSYSPTYLSDTIQTLMNKEVYNATSGVGFDYILGPDPGVVDGSACVFNARQTGSAWNPDGNFQGISPFIVNYNSVTNRIMFGATVGNFTLNFAKQEIYDPNCDVNKAIFHQYTKWGLPAYLGFDKKNYTGTSIDIAEGNGSNTPFQNSIGGLYLPHDTTPWLTPAGRKLTFPGTGSNIPAIPSTTATVETLSQVSWVDASFNLDINGEDALYMEIDRYNSIDEIYPYSERTGHLYNNDLGHRVNGSFAKIPLTHVPFGQEMGSRNNFVLNVFHSDPPIQRIDRLKFIFRYHDGRLVDFKNLPFSFTLEFNMLKDEQERGKTVRVPPLYNL